MSSSLSESFYLLDAGAEEPAATRPHPPAPLLPVAIGLILGIACDARWVLRAETCVCGFVAAAIGLLVCGDRELLRQALLALAAAAAGAVLHDAHFRRLPENHIARFVPDQPVLASVRGYVARSPWLVQSKGGPAGEAVRTTRSKFVLALEEAQTESGSVAVSGLLLVNVQEPVFDLYAGERVGLFGKLYKPAEPDNPGEPDWAQIQRRQGIHAGFICEFPEAIEKLPAKGGAGIRLLNRLRLEARTLLLDDIHGNDPDNRSLLGALVLGQRTEMDPGLVEAFRRTGTLHFLALSGMHISMLAFFVWFVGRAAALPKRIVAASVLAVLIVYAVLVEPSPSVIRASLIGIVLCIGYILRAPVNSLNSMCLAAILLLLWDPLQLFHPGFQLSFLVTLGIIYLTPVVVGPLKNWLRSPTASAAADVISQKIAKRISVKQNLRAMIWASVRAGTLRTVVYTLCVSLAAWLVGTPLAAYHFNSLFTYGWPFTSMISPFMFLTMLSGFLKLGLGLVWPSTGTILGPMLSGSAEMLEWVVRLLARTPAAAIDVPRPPGWWLILYYALLVGLVLRSRPGLTRPIGRRSRRLAALVMLLFIAVMPYWRLRLMRGELRITALAVGSGNATIVEMPNGEVWLYDVGSLGDFDVGQMTLMPALRERGIRRIDTVIISHPNYDHYSGLFFLCEHLPIGRVLISPHFERFASPGESDHRLLEELRGQGIEIGYLQRGAQGTTEPVPSPEGTLLEILWPPPNLPTNTAANDTSLVIRLEYAGHRVLFTGDIERYAQEQLLAWGLDLQADVLMLPHHGSVTPATSRFIGFVRPRYTLRSSGKLSAGSAPSAIEDITSGTTYLNTADVGAITIRLRPDGLVGEGFHRARWPDWDEIAQ